MSTPKNGFNIYANRHDGKGIVKVNTKIFRSPLSATGEVNRLKARGILHNVMFVPASPIRRRAVSASA